MIDELEKLERTMASLACPDAVTDPHGDVKALELAQWLSRTCTPLKKACRKADDGSNRRPFGWSYVLFTDLFRLRQRIGQVGWNVL